MKNGLLIALAVLVPFAALVALGFGLLKDPPPVEVHEYRAPPPVMPVHDAPPKVNLGGPMRHALDVSVDVKPPPPPPPPPAPAPPAPPPPPPVELSEEAKKLPVVAAVEPLIMQCFKDIAGHAKEPMRVTVSFEPTAEGGYANVVIKKISWPDPNLSACVLDSFLDAHFQPTGFPLRRQSRTFTYGYTDGGQ